VRLHGAGARRLRAQGRQGPDIWYARCSARMEIARLVLTLFPLTVDDVCVVDGDKSASDGIDDGK
jgi:hypothetical protein